MGGDFGGSGLFWMTEGDPNQWPIVVRGRDTGFERFEMGLTTFLAKVFSHQINPIMWSHYLEELSEIEFTPGE